MTNLNATEIATAPLDPMLETIKAYRAGQAAFDAVFDATPPDRQTLEMEDALSAATYGPSHDAILRAAPARPKVKSIAGVREALRLTCETGEIGDIFYENLLREALAYLDGIKASTDAS